MIFKLPISAENALDALKSHNDLTVKLILSPEERMSSEQSIHLANSRIESNRQWVSSISSIAAKEDLNITAIDKNWLANKLIQTARSASRYTSENIPSGHILKPHDRVRIEAMEKVSDTAQREHSSLVITHPDAINGLAQFCLLNHDHRFGFQPLLDAENAAYLSCSLAPQDFFGFAINSAQLLSEAGMTEFLYNAQKVGNQLACFDINFPS
ncbi:hypothetical protein [Serratia symbiotica]|uniref:hypothetical protein n=1 Tax=Serratia symbiotica TaxID=138074 RepID=UPI0013243F59|nr:hypothetical protein [Serratia symbiotica]QTP13374.1 hypothetical protein GPZ83_0000095 [Serratia symbiotica]